MEFTRNKKNLLFIASAVGCVSLAYMFYKRFYLQTRKKRLLRRASEVFNYLDIKIVATVKESRGVVEKLRSNCQEHHSLGFDCEWVSGKSGRRPVSLLQLSTYNGYCVLFRLHMMESIPIELMDLLNDPSIYKVGVAPHDDANYLLSDYGINIASTIDIRHLMQLLEEHASGLGNMAQDILGVTLDKRRKTRCSDWEVPELSPSQVHYAASDAHAAIKIFVKLVTMLDRSRFWKLWSKETDDIWSRIDDLCLPYADRKFKPKVIKLENSKKASKVKSVLKQPKSYLARSKPLYDNCLMQAPDGELLCTCETKKALWYVSKELADVVSESPFSVRLRFEPAGRSVGEVGRFYTTLKENKCVVCGLTNSFIRKNVVPREYRKYFPELMKDHSSHDVLLLCLRCHQRSNASDRSVRELLATRCGTPLSTSSPYEEDPACKKIRNAARALLFNGKKHVLPESRRKELETVLLSYYPDHSEVTDQLLNEASSNTIIFENKDYESHGQKVVEYFMQQDHGLLELEEIWRQHFLDVMKPRYLPEHWSLKHNEERLYMKYKEGRINDEDWKSIGIKKINW